MTAALFYVFAALTVSFTLMVVLLRDPVTSVLSLVASFFSVSAVFVLLHAPFLGILQVLIYAGAILVLFLYVVMLSDLKKEREAVGLSGRLIRLAAVGLLLPGLIVLASHLGVAELPAARVTDSFGSMASVGRNLLGPYALVFEAISLVLLAGMIGVIVLVPGRKKGDA